MVGLLAQIEAFFLTALLGILAGLIFHFYQLLIRCLKLKKYSLYVMDFFLWVAMIGIISVGILLINHGEIRIYVFISLVLGIIIYFKKFSKYTSLVLQKFAVAVITAFRGLAGLLLWPFLKAGKAIKCHYLKKKPPDNPDPPDCG